MEKLSKRKRTNDMLIIPKNSRSKSTPNSQLTEVKLGGRTRQRVSMSTDVAIAKEMINFPRKFEIAPLTFNKMILSTVKSMFGPDSFKITKEAKRVIHLAVETKMEEAFKKAVDYSLKARGTDELDEFDMLMALEENNTYSTEVAIDSLKQ